MKDPTFGGCLIRNRAGILIDIIPNKDQYQAYLGDDIIGTFHTLEDAVSFGRNYGTDY